LRFLETFSLIEKLFIKINNIMDALPVVTFNDPSAPCLPTVPQLPMFTAMNSSPSPLPSRPTLNLGLRANSEPFPAMTPMNSGFTPMLLSTHSSGLQMLTPMLNVQPSVSPVPGLPVMQPFVPLGLPMVSMTPSLSPSPRVIKPEMTRSRGSLTVPGSYNPSASTEDFSVSYSRERDHIYTVEPFETERLPEKEPVVNGDNIPIPEFTPEMTKKDLVNGTLDWFYAVLGSEHFDCEGRRGKNVLRIKVKTRGALEYICPLINQCIEEGLLNHVSCPISTKKQRRHIRGYLAYLEAVSESATDRMIEIFNEINNVLVKNCDGILEHPFKGISRNPIPVRSLKDNNQMAA